MVDVRPLENKQALAELISHQPLQPFLQSWAWGEFQQALGRRVWRVGGYEGQKLVGAALAIEHELSFGKKYLYCPRGPVADTPEALRALLVALREVGKKEHAMYVKADPNLYHFAADPVSLADKYDLGTTLQPQQTLVLNTMRSPDEILASMHSKTRYNIRLAQKKNVVVRWSASPDDLQVFLRLMHQTGERQGIRLHRDHYYQKLFFTLQSANMAELVVGEYEGQIRAAHLIIWHGQTATYLHGGSDDATKEAMVPYVLQWETIIKAHHKGIKEYDLWGVAPDDAPTHKWAGITRFKRGFGGRHIVFPPALNAIIDRPWYSAYRLAKRIRGGVDG